MFRNFPRAPLRAKDCASSRNSGAGDTATFVVSGVGGHTYLVKAGGDAQITSVENAESVEDHGQRMLRIAFPDSASGGYQTKTVTVHLRKR